MTPAEFVRHGVLAMRRAEALESFRRREHRTLDDALANYVSVPVDVSDELVALKCACAAERAVECRNIISRFGSEYPVELVGRLVRVAEWNDRLVRLMEKR